MNRYQRRKRALERKEAKADLLLSRAIIRKQQIVKEALKDARLRAELLKGDNLSAQERALLSFRKREPKQMGLRSNAKGWLEGFSSRGANGKALFDVAKEEVGKHGKPGKRAHSAFNHDPYALQGEKVSASYAKERYATALPNCQRAAFKGPFKKKA
jgi:hypothetical protein